MRRFFYLALILFTLTAASPRPQPLSASEAASSNLSHDPARAERGTGQSPTSNPTPLRSVPFASLQGSARGHGLFSSFFILHSSFIPHPSSFILQSTDLALAQTYAPVLYFHAREHYRPQPIEVMLDHARLRGTVSGVEATLIDHPTIEVISTATDDAYLDLWYGQDNTSGYLNYTAHASYYEQNGLRDAYPLTAYARVVHAPDGRIAIQYWLFYYYNDWYNKHEGDWEMVQVELDTAEQPARAVYAQHHGGTARPWAAIDTVDGTHPKAYVALGSHATYFVGDALFPQGADVGNVHINVYDRTGSDDPAIPQVQLISEADAPWLAFAGRWGERAFGDFSGPTGPARKGEQWDDPFAWADRQPADADEWYHRNLRVEIDAPPEAAALAVTTPGEGDIIAQARSQIIVAHGLPDPALTYSLKLEARQSITSTLAIEWPDTANGVVVRREYALSLPAGGSAAAQLCGACDFALDSDANGDGAPEQRILPARSRTTEVDFNPPEFVLSYLPFDQVGVGLIAALIATIAPTAVYSFGVWWLDRYEKEPIRLLAITFLWGAIPGALVAVAARFFVAGVAAPVLTETVKFIAIGIIFTRFRREFDDVLDGIVYGALAGIGFAMTTNLINYVVGFLFGGFEFLRTSVLTEGVAFGLNEAYYGALIGVGFGVSRWATDRRLHIWSPFVALAVAIVLHLFTDYWRDLAVGGQQALVIIPFLATWAGILAVIALAFFSLRKEQETMRNYLQAEVDLRTLTPNEFFYLSTPARRAQMLLRDVQRGPAEFARAVQLQDLARQLAFRRRELEMRQRHSATDAVLAALRQRIAALRPPPKPHDNR